MIRPACALASLLARAAPAFSADPPKVAREEIEWLDVWVPGNGNKELPRVLLIGDSITRGYYTGVADKLYSVRRRMIHSSVARIGISGEPAFRRSYLRWLGSRSR